MDESDRISEEAYQMIMNQKEGCTCGICCTLFMFENQELIWEIFNDMLTHSIKKENKNCETTKN